MGKKRKQFPLQVMRFDNEGRTVLIYSDSTHVRFDTENDRIEFEAWCDVHGRFVEAADRQDYAEAARLVVHALNEGIIEDTDELIEECGADDTTLEVIRLEFEKLENDALSACINAIQMRWPIEGGKGGTDGTTR